MKHFAFVAVGLVATSQAASAAPFDWTGFYAGFNLGTDAGSSTFTDQPSGNGLPWLIIGDTFTANRTGPSVGVQAGYNLQVNSLVLGVEGDAGYLGGDGRGESASVSPPGSGIYGYIQPGSYVSVRARVGVAVDRVLAYATAGGIMADHRAYMQDAAFGGLTAETGMVGGWIAGVGFEYALTDDWALKLDALHYSLATTTVRGSDPVAGPTYDVASHGDLVRLGLNYKF